MRTLALAFAAAVCLGSPAAQALCTTGVECIRERFGQDSSLRNNRIIDRTDRLGDRGRPLNPYIAGQNVAGQARRAGRFDSTRGGTAADRYAADPLRPGEVRPDVRYTPGTAIEPYAPGSLIPGEVPSELQAAPDLAVSPYEPALPSIGPATDAGAGRRSGELGTAPRVQAPARNRSPAAAGSDQNRPQGAADLRYSTPRSSGAYR